MDDDRRPFSRWHVCLAAIATLMIARTPVSVGAQDVTLQSAGGTGGNPYTLSCGTNALVGLQGEAGTNILGQAVVFNLSLWCVGLNADGSWVGSPSITGAMVGKTSVNFPTVDMKCPTHMAVSGIKGRAGSYVSDVEVVCSSIGAGGLLFGSPRGPDVFAGVAQIAGSGLVYGTLIIAVAG